METRNRILLGLVTTLAACAPAGASGQEALCREAERFLGDVGMIARTDPDTIDDWRTQAMVPGCRVTAAGATRRTDAQEVERVYGALQAEGWMRTPDPRDAPNEASLRYRMGDADCLFNFYGSDTALNTDAEMEVIDAVTLQPGERLFNFLVMCTPTARAAPRGD